MSKSTPEVPDPQDTSAAQTSTNIGSSIANNIMGMMSETDPTGSVSYTQTGTTKWTDPYTGETYDIPTYSKETVLNDVAQQTYDYSQQAEQNLAKVAMEQSDFLSGYLGERLDPNTLPERGQLSTADDITAIRNEAEQALLDRMAPSIESDRAALEADLVNRGVNIGSEAYSDAHYVQGQKENDAELAAILAAGQEASNALNMDISRASYQDGQRGQALEEMFAFRNQPINEISALLAGSQVTMPQFASYTPATIPTTDVAGNIWNAYSAEADQAAAESAFWGNLIGAGGTIAGAWV